MNTRMSLIKNVTDDALFEIETKPDVDQPLLQFIDVMNFRLVDLLLQIA